MRKITRTYAHLILDHLKTCRQMVFLPGPRQVGKTTLVKEFLDEYSNSLYLNWDNIEHRKRIQNDQRSIVTQLKLEEVNSSKRLIIFDELHKYPLWKNWLKGLFDTYEDKLKVMVTGSAMLSVYRKGQDSMMGRYFSYRVHPLSVAELGGKAVLEKDITFPKKIDNDDFQALIQFGGFPEPFLHRSTSRHGRWSKTREDFLFEQDMRDLTNVQEISQIRLLAQLLTEQVGQNTSYSSLARKVQVTHPTIKKWLTTLEYIYYSFSIKPWTKNITRSLIKEPKYYLWDWSQIKDEGARKENMVASHLLKAVHYWTDIGLGRYGLYYLRDKDKREVDFLVTKDEMPWFLVEVKNSNNKLLTPALKHFYKMTGAPYAFQVVFDLPYYDVDCFDEKKPYIVSAHTFLSQLV